MNRTLKLALLVAALFASHAVVLRCGWDLRGAEVDVQRATVAALEERVELLAIESVFWQERAVAARDRIARGQKRIVEVTAYTASRRECDADPHIAASNKPPVPGTVAVSRDLFDLGWTFGKQVYLKGLGPYTINDVMNPRFQMRVDVFLDHRKRAKEFGVRTTEAILG